MKKNTSDASDSTNTTAPPSTDSQLDPNRTTMVVEEGRSHNDELQEQHGLSIMECPKKSDTKSNNNDYTNNKTMSSSSMMSNDNSKKHRQRYSSTDIISRRSDNMSITSSAGDDSSAASTVSTGRRSARLALVRNGAALFYLCIAAGVSVIVFAITRASQKRQYKSDFTSLSDKVVQSFEFNLGNTLSAIRQLSTEATSTAITTNATWPFFTLPNYYFTAGSALDLSNTLSVGFHLVVLRNNREAWETYTEQHIDWYWEALQTEKDGTNNIVPSKSEEEESFDNYDLDEDKKDENSDGMRRLSVQDTRAEEGEARFPQGYSKEIYRFDSIRDTLAIESYSKHFYVPTWQVMPLTGRTINYNQYSRSIVQDGLLEVLNRKKAVLIDLQDVGTDATSSQNEYYNALLQDTTNQGYPLTDLYYPVFENFDNDQDAQRVVAIVSMTISFQRVLSNILPANSPEVICVIENACDRAFTYTVDGKDATFLGEGDLHDVDYDQVPVNLEFSSISPIEQTWLDHPHAALSDDFCPYKLHIYPSSEFKDKYITKEPIYYAVATAIAFLLVAIIIVTYDFLVQRRIRMLLQDSKVGGAIVSSILPENIRKRLLHKDMSEIAQRVLDDNKKKSNDNKIFGDIDRGLLLSSSAREIPSDGSKSTSHAHAALLAEPIADSFPHCTILFAYIDGFNNWSTGRSPTDVFTLLESIFLQLDKLAKRNKVFKIETIGNCYVATTGVPDSQPDHAERMAKFAVEAMSCVAKKVQKLESKLGEGTDELCLRIGLHSGPVTAGLMGGQLFRFQIFGDTVNTASRIATTGLSNCIHVSHTTTEYLGLAGKESWVVPRKELVKAKGKGVMATFWLSKEAILEEQSTTSSKHYTACEDSIIMEEV